MERWKSMIGDERIRLYKEQGLWSDKNTILSHVEVRGVGSGNSWPA